MKKLFAILLISLVASCSSAAVNKEDLKSAKSRSASDRINSSQSNTTSILKELDE